MGFWESKGPATGRHFADRRGREREREREREEGGGVTCDTSFTIMGVVHASEYNYSL